MIKGVFFDFGGVITSSPFEAFTNYERVHGLPEAFIRKINANNPDNNAWAKFERHELSLEEFDDAFAVESERAGHRLSGRDIVQLISGEIQKEMVAALKKLQGEYHLVCITNNVPVEAVKPRFISGDDYSVKYVLSLFEQVFESSKLKIRKPEPAIYHMACDSVGLRPDQVVYLDDLGVNLKPARAMGMHTIKVESAVTALSMLSTVLGRPGIFD